ncbi:putative RNA-directed DNA polymerase from transposon X-element [Trichonephila clavipes]|nr:putative RNA-directed DNA polymerase from transposon X-element [Trichonephila clavipes]
MFKISETTKIRPVFDATAREGNNPSLNDCLLKVPNLIELIPNILDRFRIYPIGLSADIEKAFLQISVTPEHRDFLRFFYPHENNEIVYRHCRLVFGVCLSPFLLAASINHLLDNTSSKYMDIVSKLRHSFYVDNCVTGVSNTQEIGSFVNKVRKIMSNGCFNLRGWESNVKKNLFRNGIFDPLGILTAATLLPKMWLQETWKVKLAWDSPLPLGLCNKFDKWFTEILLLQNLEIPRYCEMNSDSDLHVSVDASKEAYAACIFVRTKLASGIKLHLLRAKARVAPTKCINASEIARISSPDNWRHVPGRMNPADVLSRGCSPRHLLESKWFGGPEWLLGDAVTWPTNELQCETKVLDLYRAVHLELVTALSTNNFLLSLRRFIARRGMPSVVYTDNGTNFKGAVREFKNLDWIKIERETEIQRIKWKFNPPTAAWWERLIRVLKDLLKHALQKAHKTIRALKVGEIVLIENSNKKRLYWSLGKVIELIPQVHVETPLHPEKLTVWCALWAGGIIGPYFFKNEEGHNVTVNGDRYRAMITNFFIPELNNHDVQELWFQQDGATCHTARAIIDLLKDTFGDRLISRFGPVNWPPRSCDLTPLDYFLWGYVKSLVYADKPQTLDHLEDNIRRVIADIRPQMLEKVTENWTSRLDYIRASRGNHMPEIIFKM